MFRLTSLVAAAVATIALIAPAALAVEVTVTITGEVSFNLIEGWPLEVAGPGDGVTMSFVVDSESFVNSASFPTRGYPIDPASFSMVAGSAVAGLQDPLPDDQTPYLVLRDNDPAVDGFFISTNVDNPHGIPLAQAGTGEQLRCDFLATYGSAALVSLDLLDAVGRYDLSGLSVFHWTVDDGPASEMGIDFHQMTVAVTAPLVWDQSDVDPSGWFDITGAVGANDFTLPRENSLLALDVFLVDGAVSSNGALDNFGGTLSWALYDNGASGHPGGLIASGSTSSPALTDTCLDDPSGGDVFRARIDFDPPLSLPSGTHWLALHEGEWLSPGDETAIGWARAGAVSASAVEATTTTPGIWTPQASDSAFVLYAGAGPPAGDLVFASGFEAGAIHAWQSSGGGVACP